MLSELSANHQREEGDGGRLITVGGATIEVKSLKSQKSINSQGSNASGKETSLKEKSHTNEEESIKAGSENMYSIIRDDENRAAFALEKERELQQFKEQDAYYLNVSIIDARIPYGYEYLGNT